MGEIKTTFQFNISTCTSFRGPPARNLKNLVKIDMLNWKVLFISPMFYDILSYCLLLLLLLLLLLNDRWNENNHVSIQHINLYKLSEVTASIIKYTSILIVNCLQEFINKLLNLETRYPIATNKSYQIFITDIVKLK